MNLRGKMHSRLVLLELRSASLSGLLSGENTQPSSSRAALGLRLELLRATGLRLCASAHCLLCLASVLGRNDVSARRLENLRGFALGPPPASSPAAARSRTLDFDFSSSPSSTSFTFSFLTTPASTPRRCNSPCTHDQPPPTVPGLLFPAHAQRGKPNNGRPWITWSRNLDSMRDGRLTRRAPGTAPF